MGLRAPWPGFLLSGWLLFSMGGCQSHAHPPKGALAPSSLSMVAVGDILMHQDVKAVAAKDPEGFQALWRDVSPLFQEADLAFGNLESPVAPSTGRPGVPFQFNAPETLPAALRACGFTVLSTANNHAFDQGPKGVRETLERLKQGQLLAIGSGVDRSEAEALSILERQGIKVAFLAFTDLFNVDLNRRATEPWVRTLDLEPALRAVREARSRADLVVVSLHWGNEYQHQPTNRQRTIARALVEAGCDVLLGHHPHVLQPLELLEVAGRKALVAYSLGNFISNQDRMYRADLFPVAGGDNRDGVALKLRFERRAGDSATVALQQVEVEPLWTENSAATGASPRAIRVIRVKAAENQVRCELDQLTDPKARSGDAVAEGQRRRMILEKQEYLRTLILRRQRISDMVGERFLAR